MEEHRSKKLLDQVCDTIRLKHYSYRTGQACVGWIKHYITSHDVRPPSGMGAPEMPRPHNAWSHLPSGSGSKPLPPSIIASQTAPYYQGEALSAAS